MRCALGFGVVLAVVSMLMVSSALAADPVEVMLQDFEGFADDAAVVEGVPTRVGGEVRVSLDTGKSLGEKSLKMVIGKPHPETGDTWGSAFIPMIVNDCTGAQYFEIWISHDFSSNLNFRFCFYEATGEAWLVGPEKEYQIEVLPDQFQSVYSNAWSVQSLPPGFSARVRIRPESLVVADWYNGADKDNVFNLAGMGRLQFGINVANFKGAAINFEALKFAK